MGADWPWPGTGLDTIIDELPQQGDSTEYMQYVENSTDWDVVLYDSFTFDGFESGDGTGGTGDWVGPWNFSGESSVYTDYWGAHEGSHHLRLVADNDEYPGDGYAQRQVDLSGTTGSGPYLYFWSRIDYLFGDDTIEVRVSTNGVDWNTLETFDYQDATGRYNQHWYDLSSYGRPPVFYVSFKMNGSNWWETFYVDSVEFSTYQEGSEDEWPVPPFDPQIVNHTMGPSSEHYQELKWDFEDAGYDDINFNYGQTRTMSFKAQAALAEGVYCNRIWASSTDGWPVDDEGAIISGTTAKIIVGEPEDTNCDGGLLLIEKVSDPPIVDPYVEETVEYTITIENVDTISIPIYAVEDWLPATGSDQPDEGFMYMDNSTTARIIRPLRVASDDFESGDGNGGTGEWSDNWTLSGEYSFSTSWPHSGTYQLLLQGDDDENPGDGYAERQVDLSGYSNVELRFWAKLSDLEPGNEVDVNVSTDGENWDPLHTFVDGDDDNAYHPHEFDLSDYGGSSTFYIAFDAEGLDKTWQYYNWNYDYFYVDDIEFLDPTAESEIPVCMPDVNDGPWQFFSEFWEGYGYYDEDRWSVTWDFAYYPNSEDSVWDTGGLCQTFEYTDYSPALILYPGEILEIVFQAHGTLTYSGSYFNEVMVKIYEDGTPWEWDDEWLYSGQTGTVIVPQYDLEAETLSSVLHANAMLGPYGHWWRSWHWWWHW